MTPFYYIDGPWKGNIQKTDFRPIRLTSGETYYKYTFAKRTDFGLIFTGVASVNPDLKELKIEEGIPFFIRSEQEMNLKVVPVEGEIE